MTDQASERLGNAYADVDFGPLRLYRVITGDITRTPAGVNRIRMPLRRTVLTIKSHRQLSGAATSRATRSAPMVG